MRKFCVIDFISACCEKEMDRHRGVMTELCDKMIVYETLSDDYKAALAESRTEMIRYKAFFLFVFSNIEMDDAIKNNELELARLLVSDFVQNRA